MKKNKELKLKKNSKIEKSTGGKESEYILTGIVGFDNLFEKRIVPGSSIVLAGGAGTGKTIFCLQIIHNLAKMGKKCLYMSFEESEKRLIDHMKDFGWDAEELIKSKNLKIDRVSPFGITRNIEAILAREKGELLIEVEPLLIPKDFHPDFIFIDSLTAIASTFTEKEDTYRIYIEQLFRMLEEINVTSFLITETKQNPEIFSTTGVEEFLADGVVVLYSFREGMQRKNAIEVLKMRGARHKKSIFPMEITDKGIVINAEKEIDLTDLKIKEKFDLIQASLDLAETRKKIDSGELDKKDFSMIKKQRKKNR